MEVRLEHTLAQTVDTEGLEKLIRHERAEARNLMRLAARTGDELGIVATEIKQRTDQLRTSVAALERAQRGPETTLEAIDQIEQAAHADLQNLRAALLADPGCRDVYQALFPEGLVFETVEVAPRHQVWALTGRAHLSGPQKVGDPNGMVSKVTLTRVSVALLCSRTWR